MKATIILVFSAFLISASLQGQGNRFNQKSGVIRIDTAALRHYFDKINDSSFYNIPENSHLFQGETHDPYFDLTPNNKYKAPIRFKNYPGFIIAEEIPQSNGFTDNMPIIRPDTGGKLQIIKPDTSIKGFLKIVKPNGWIDTK
jgi:hypothetical protein